MRSLSFVLWLSTCLFFARDCYAQYELRLIYNWQDTTLPGSFAFNNAYNEVWGYAAAGREYAIIGSTIGTHFFDVTDTSDIRDIDFVPGAVAGPIIIHRDYHDLDGYLYIVCDEGLSTLQIVDLSYLPDSVHVVCDSDTLFNQVHNIFIDSITKRLYTCSESKAAAGSHALGIYSLADALNPQLLTYWEDVGGVHDVFVRNDTAFLNCGGEGLWVMDFTDVQNPQLIVKIDAYAEQGYNHSGWWSDDRNAYVFADETWGTRLKACAADDLGNLSIESLFGSMVDTNSIAHNIIIKDTIAYVSYYHDGLWLFNISDLTDVKPLANYDTYLWPDHDSYRGVWGVYPLLPSGLILVSDMQTGLYVFTWEDTSQMTSVLLVQNFSTKVFPNPCIDHTNVTVTSNESFNIYDMRGESVKSGRLTPGVNRIALNQLPAGIYSIQLIDESDHRQSMLLVIR